MRPGRQPVLDPLLDLHEPHRVLGGGAALALGELRAPLLAEPAGLFLQHARELGAGGRERALELGRPLLVLGFDQRIELGSLGVELILGRAAAHASILRIHTRSRTSATASAIVAAVRTPESLLRAAEKSSGVTGSASPSSRSSVPETFRT